MLKRLLVVIGLVVCGLSIASPSYAKCTVVNPTTGECMVSVTDPGEDGPGGGGGGGGGSETGGGCKRNGQEIPCSIDGRVWLGECYAIVVVPVDPPEDHTGEDGAWYACVEPLTDDLIWVPGGAPMPPNPVDLARQAISSMTLKAIPIGIVPEDTPGKVGIVGMPVWMWSKSSAAAVAGPISKTASVGAYSVTATARLARVVWTMGDGKTVVCAGSNAMGTEYKDRYDTQSSPTCGHRYNQPGKYEVRATSHWEVEWAGIGQTGTITLELYDTTDIRVSEVQVLTQ